MKLEESRGQINRSLIEVSASQKRLEHQRDQLVMAIQKFAEQAQTAVKADREDLCLARSQQSVRRTRFQLEG